VIEFFSFWIHTETEETSNLIGTQTPPTQKTCKSDLIH
jgi:hypothetical protein